MLRKLGPEALAIQKAVATPIVIAHRGLSHWAPEETAPAYLVARELGVDYLEADLQLTSDGEVVAVHDDDLKRTTNVQTVFPGQESYEVREFTLRQIKTLDAGSWFNAEHPARARRSFAGAEILTLDELVTIAESGEHCPGLYLETKNAKDSPHIERAVHRILTTRGWVGGNRREKPAGFDPGQVDVGFGDARVILQTFERNSLGVLDALFPGVPKLWLLWRGEGYVHPADEETLVEWTEYGLDHGAHFLGPNHEDLMEDWMVEIYRARGFGLHLYTIDTPEGFRRYAPAAAGIFTNRADLLLDYYERPREDLQAVFARLGR